MNREQTYHKALVNIITITIDRDYHIALIEINYMYLIAVIQIILNE